MKFPRWTREPLVHFLAGGALLYAFFALRGDEPDPASRVIEVDRTAQAQVALGFQQLMNRPPTDAELDALIDRYVREEVLYREALRLGLDRDDAIVRRRLAQKMEMLASARAETERPSDEILRQWFREHPARFAEEPAYTFDQLWFEDQGAASAALARLGADPEWRGDGESISLPPRVEKMPRAEVSERFGAQFAGELAGLAPAGKWQGPVSSGFGWHLVRLREIDAGNVPAFESVRQEVENDWRAATIEARKEEAYRVLREAYRVEIAR